MSALVTVRRVLGQLLDHVFDLLPFLILLALLMSAPTPLTIHI